MLDKGFIRELTLPATILLLLLRYWHIAVRLPHIATDCRHVMAKCRHVTRELYITSSGASVSPLSFL